jgi:transcription-repair coupling factor (superfamily II helicase)
MRDLDIRGAGNLLGAEQSGFINDLGFDTYHKILDDAIQELKETEFKELFASELAEKARLIAQDCVIETDLEILIPETYVSNTSERLQLYSTLDNVKDEDSLDRFRSSLLDRFGELPASVEQLINSVRLRWIGEELGFEKITLKNEKLRGQFVSGKDDYFKSDLFGRIISYIQAHSRVCRMKDSNGKLLLTIENIKSVDEALRLLAAMSGYNLRSAKEIISS